jgi:hypothetical protein
MTSALLVDRVDRRVLGGFFFSDAVTGASILDPLIVRNTQLQLRLNRSGVYAIFNAPGFGQLSAEFDVQPDWPTANGPSFEITVLDPSLRYLARRAMVQAPQALASLTKPQQVVLYPSPSAVTEPNWAIVRANVTAIDGSGLPWAVVQVIRSDNTVAATGMTDARGEALLAVTGLGVQVSANGSGSVTETTIPVIVKAWFDPGVLQQPAGWIPNPDDILTDIANAALKTGSMTGALGARQILLAAISISV